MGYPHPGQDRGYPQPEHSIAYPPLGLDGVPSIQDWIIKDGGTTPYPGQVPGQDRGYPNKNSITTLPPSRTEWVYHPSRLDGLPPIQDWVGVLSPIQFRSQVRTGGYSNWNSIACTCSEWYSSCICAGGLSF